MNESNNSRPELDDVKCEDWNLTFKVFAPGADNSIECFSKYSALITKMPENIRPMFSLDENEITFSLRVNDTTQKQATMHAYSNLLVAFENAEQTFVLEAARIAPRLSVEMAKLNGEAIEMQDISLEIIDLERQMTTIRDIE